MNISPTAHAVTVESRAALVSALPAARAKGHQSIRGVHMQINPAFPPSRLDMPKRRAEQQIYQSLAASAVPGRALYEVKVTPAAIQVDFLVWAEGVAAYSAQVKGGAISSMKGSSASSPTGAGPPSRGCRPRFGIPPWRSPITWSGGAATASSSSRSWPCPTWSRTRTSRTSRPGTTS